MQKILGLGNALVDILTLMQSDDSLLLLDLPKGSMQLVDSKKMNAVHAHIETMKKQMVTGGSAANTISGLASLGIETGFIGKIGEDSIGNFFRESMTNSGVKTNMLNSELHSGSCIVLVSPDSERTMCTHLGATNELHPDELTIDLFKGFDFFHMEGYLVQNHELIQKAARLAKESGLKVSLDMASYNVVEENLEFLNNLITNYIDIVFANEEEAVAFTQHSVEGALKKIGELCEIVVVKIGEKGSLIYSGEQVFQVETPAVKAIDTTGAGDLYASGFLYGLAKGKNLQTCGEIGSLVASHVVQTIGTKMDASIWKEIAKAVE